MNIVIFNLAKSGNNPKFEEEGPMKTINLSKGLCWLTIGIFILIISGCATMIPTRVLKPAEVNLAGFNNITIMDFEGKNGKNFSRWVEAELIKVKLNGGSYFKLVSRTQLEKVLTEQALQMTGAIDPKK